MASQSAVHPATRPSLTLKRHLKATPARVYAAWTEPQSLIRWFGPGSVVPDTVRAQIDARPGGRYHIAFDNDRGEHNEVGGVYHELVPHVRLVFSWAWHSTPERESLVTVTLQPDDAGTLLTLHHEQFVDADARNAHEHGWISTLDKLERLFA
jgi:uncharacterized protein YndB with AHSA1/START domain